MNKGMDATKLSYITQSIEGRKWINSVVKDLKEILNQVLKRKLFKFK